MIPIPTVNHLDVALGCNALSLLPPWKDIPDEFKRDRSKWCQVVSDWFFCGLRDVKWTPKSGVDTQKAIAVIKACIGSFEPSHEHKEAGCAYLLSEWFEDVTYTKRKP